MLIYTVYICYLILFLNTPRLLPFSLALNPTSRSFAV